MRCATPRHCPTGHSGPRSCATTMRSTYPGSPPTSGRRCSPHSARKRTCACTDEGSAVGSRPCSAGTRALFGWPPRFQFTLRGTPVIRYGEEIGMGDDLSLPDRESIRTPMQWSPLPNAGFSAAAADQLVHPVVADGTFGYEKVNVRVQRNDPDSLLSWFERMMRTLCECPEINTGTCTHVDVPTPPGLLVHRADDTTGTMLFLHNLGDHDATVDVSSIDDIANSPTEMLADRNYGDIDLAHIAVVGR